MKKRSIFSLLLLFLCILVLTTCSSSKKKTTITFWVLENHLTLFMQSIIDSFMEENPDIDVVSGGYGTDPIKEALKVAASSKTLPDIWFTWGGSLGSFYVENNLTMDLTTVAKDHKWKDIYNNAALDLCTYDGKISGVPYHLLGMATFYQKDIYEKLGLNPPKTFDEFESQLETIKNTGITPLGFGSKFGWHTMRLTEQLLEHYAGPDKHDQLNTLSASWNYPDVVKTFEKLLDWSEKGYFPKGFVSLDPTEAETLYSQKKSVLIIEGNWWDGSMVYYGADPKDNDFFKFPTDQNPVRMSAFAEMFQISGLADKARQEAAIKLAEYITSLEMINKHIDNYGAPATLGFQPSVNSPHVKQMSDKMNEGVYLITDQALPQIVAQKLFEAQDKVVLKEWTPKQAAEAMQKAATEYKESKK